MKVSVTTQTSINILFQTPNVSIEVNWNNVAFSDFFFQLLLSIFSQLKVQQNILDTMKGNIHVFSLILHEKTESD